MSFPKRSCDTHGKRRVALEEPQAPANNRNVRPNNDLHRQRQNANSMSTPRPSIISTTSPQRMHRSAKGPSNYDSPQSNNASTMFVATRVPKARGSAPLSATIKRQSRDDVSLDNKFKQKYKHDASHKRPFESISEEAPAHAKESSLSSPSSSSCVSPSSFQGNGARSPNKKRRVVATVAHPNHTIRPAVDGSNVVIDATNTNRRRDTPKSWLENRHIATYGSLGQARTNEQQQQQQRGRGPWQQPLLQPMELSSSSSSPSLRGCGTVLAAAFFGPSGAVSTLPYSPSSTPPMVVINPHAKASHHPRGGDNDDDDDMLRTAKMEEEWCDQLQNCFNSIPDDVLLQNVESSLSGVVVVASTTNDAVRVKGQNVASVLDNDQPATNSIDLKDAKHAAAVVKRNTPPPPASQKSVSRDDGLVGGKVETSRLAPVARCNSHAVSPSKNMVNPYAKSFAKPTAAAAAVAGQHLSLAKNATNQLECTMVDEIRASSKLVYEVEEPSLSSSSSPSNHGVTASFRMDVPIKIPHLPTAADRVTHVMPNELLTNIQSGANQHAVVVESASNDSGRNDELKDCYDDKVTLSIAAMAPSCNSPAVLPSNHGIHPCTKSSFTKPTPTQNLAPARNKQEFQAKSNCCFGIVAGADLVVDVEESSMTGLSLSNQGAMKSFRHAVPGTVPHAPTPGDLVILDDTKVEPDQLVTNAESATLPVNESVQSDEVEDYYYDGISHGSRRIHKVESANAVGAPRCNRLAVLPSNSIVNPCANNFTKPVTAAQNLSPVRNKWEDESNRCLGIVAGADLAVDVEESSVMALSLSSPSNQIATASSPLDLPATFPHLPTPADADADATMSTVDPPVTPTMCVGEDSSLVSTPRLPPVKREYKGDDDSSGDLESLEENADCHELECASTRLSLLNATDGTSSSRSPCQLVDKATSPVPTQHQDQSTTTNTYARHVTAQPDHELPIPSHMVFQVVFNEEEQWKLLSLGILPSDPDTFDLNGTGWTESKLAELCDIWKTEMDLLHAKSQEMKEVIFESTVKVLRFFPIPISEVFALEFPQAVLKDRFFFDESNKVQVGIFEQVHSLKSDVYGKPSVISATGMQQLQPSTDVSDSLFEEGRTGHEVELFDAMVREAVCGATKNTVVRAADLKRKITYLLTRKHNEQAPHRDFAKTLLKDHRRLPITPWGLDMPLTRSGLLLNIWPKDELCRIISKGFTHKDKSQQHQLPFTLDVAFRQILLFSGSTVHGGGFQRQLGDGCFRMHMYLSFAPRRRTHAALEGQDKVELEDDDGIKYSTYLLKSDSSQF